MMNSEWKTKWVAALRSDKYRQISGGLRTLTDLGENKHCCLGVLCDIVAPDDWKAEYTYNNGQAFNHRGSGGYPDWSILAATGLIRPEAERLATMNDNGATFAQIADNIEQTL